MSCLPFCAKSGRYSRPDRSCEIFPDVGCDLRIRCGGAAARGARGICQHPALARGSRDQFRATRRSRQTGAGAAARRTVRRRKNLGSRARFEVPELATAEPVSVGSAPAEPARTVPLQPEDSSPPETARLQVRSRKLRHKMSPRPRRPGCRLLPATARSRPLPWRPNQPRRQQPSQLLKRPRWLPERIRTGARAGCSGNRHRYHDHRHTRRSARHDRGATAGQQPNPDPTIVRKRLHASERSSVAGVRRGRGWRTGARAAGQPVRRACDPRSQPLIFAAGQAGPVAIGGPSGSPHSAHDPS